MVPVLQHFRNFQILQGRPNLEALLSAATKQELVVNTRLSEEFYISSYKQFFDMGAWPQVCCF